MYIFPQYLNNTNNCPASMPLPSFYSSVCPHWMPPPLDCCAEICRKQNEPNHSSYERRQSAAKWLPAGNCTSLIFLYQITGGNGNCVIHFLTPNAVVPEPCTQYLMRVRPA